jgi:hypothetical protein
MDVAAQLNEIHLSTQAFLILCRLFDGCYDELKQQPALESVVEGTAQVLLSGVAELHEREVPPKEISLAITLEQSFFLRKLLREFLARLEENEQNGKNRQWMEECMFALGG